MKNNRIFKGLSVILAVMMLLSVLPMNALAAIHYNEAVGSEYYNVISKRDWTLAPGIEETEVVLNNDAGARRQVLHTVSVDLNNQYTKVIPGTKGMWPQEGNYGTEGTSTQAINAEKLGYGNVVAATNCSLSWYTEAYYKENPHLIGEPLGYSILDGKMYANSRFEEGKNGGGVQTIVVINYDTHPITGEPRPDDMPKAWIRLATDPLTGWEQQAIPVLFSFLVKPDANGNPVNQYKEDHGSGVASRTFVGVKADGTLIVAVSDGEQAPYSVGFTNFEMADYMIKMGCVIAANCDGGGSTSFVSQRPGEDLKINCSLADGGERPTSNTILIVSTAPADGVFAQATISSDFEYYAPGASVTFNAMGTDAVGTKVDIPSDVEWTIKESGMGSISNGVFTSNGTEGKVTVQMIYNGSVVGERTINIAAPGEIFFEQPIVTIPFGKTAKIPVKASIGGGLYEIGLGDGDVTFTTTNSALGTFNGLNFTAVEEAFAPADITSTVTASLVTNPSLTATVQLNLGKGSEVLWDFEGGQADIDEWNVINNRKNAEHWDYYLNLSLADKTNGQVHDGNYSMRLETNGLSSAASHSEQYAWIRLGVDGDAVVLENARSVGFWLYVPEDNIQCWVQGHYMYDSDGNGTLDSEATVSMMESENVYYNIDESGWHYLSMDISAFKEVALRMSKKYDIDPSDGMKGETGEFFLALVFHKAINNKLWQINGSINGNYTYYLDNFTVDYSEAVDDRENPVFDKIYMNGEALIKRDVVTTSDNNLSFSVAVEDKTFKLDADKNKIPLYNATGLDAETAKLYIDGVEIESSFADGKITADNIILADGYHRIKAEICDKVGNKSVVIRVFKVEAGLNLSTLKLVPQNPSLDRIPFGSVYYMNLEANAIETIQSVSTVIDLNNVNHWELDHMELAEGFTAEYVINKETNTATITINRTGDSIETGTAVLAKIPVRILYFDTDIKTPGYTAETYWTSYSFWAQDMKMDVDMGLITHIDGKTSTFSNEEFHVDTEMYTSMANMDKAYFAAHGSTHVHTVTALPDKEPDCTKNGYTDRTFCEVCNSVVDWGKTISATGHVFVPDAKSKKLLCACGREYTGTGLHIIGGKGYYTTAGVLTSGWITIDEEWYYFDKRTFSSVPTYNNGFVTYKFYEDGKLVSGEWHKSAEGIRYYEGPSYIRGGKAVMTWYNIDGKDYCIDKRGYVATGTRWVNDNNTGEIYTWYIFDENGVCQEKWNYTGLAEWNGTYHYVKDGVSQYGMYLIDGSYYYFYFTNYYGGIKNQEFYCKYNKGLLPAGTYMFGYDSKMVDNNVYNHDGTLYYYVLGKISQGDGVFTYNNEDFVIEESGKVLFTGIIKDAGGSSQYYENGIQVGNHKWDEGVVTAEPTCVSAGVRTYTCVDCGEKKDITINVYAHEDDNDDFLCDKCDAVVTHEHIWNNKNISTPATCNNDGLKTYTCKCGEIKNEVIKAPGHVDENGNNACDICGGAVTVKNGIVLDSDGNIRYYENGKAICAGLVVDSQGNYYYINSSLKAVKNCSYAFSNAKGNGLLPGGTYQFDVNGKLINPPASNLPHIHVWGDGNITVPADCNESGVKTYICDCGLSKTEVINKLGHIDENENFVCDRCFDMIAHTPVWNNGVITTPADCTNDGVKTFTCKCGETKTEIIKAYGHIDEDDNCQCDRCFVAVAHIHKWDNGAITTPSTCAKEGVKTYTCRCGETKTESVATKDHIDNTDDFICDECNKVLQHTHVWDNGNITTPATCTKDGVKTFTCRCGETKAEVISSPAKHIDENGNGACDICGEKVTVKNGVVLDSDGNIRYYENGVATRAGLVVDSQGNYYYINSSLKAVKNSSYAFSNSMGNGLLPGGTYQFDANGKMINPPASNLPHIHVWGDGIITTPASCTEIGVKTYICDCGLSKTEAIEKLGHIDEDQNFVCDRCSSEIAHMHEWDNGEVTVPPTCTKDGVMTYTCMCGETKTEAIVAVGSHIDENGELHCDRCGEKLSAKTGLVFDDDGNIRYYVNGIATRAGLVVDSQGNYYYINSTLKAIKNCSYVFSDAMGNGLLPGGTYQFDESGKLILNS